MGTCADALRRIRLMVCRGCNLSILKSMTYFVLIKHSETLKYNRFTYEALTKRGLYSSSQSSCLFLLAHTPCWEPVSAISHGARDLALRLANKRTTSLPEDGEPEYSEMVFSHIPVFVSWHHPCHSGPLPALPWLASTQDSPHWILPMVTRSTSPDSSLSRCKDWILWEMID